VPPRAVHSRSVQLWFYVWFLVILKIPVVYLAYVIWWAVKDPPDAETGEEGAGEAAEGGPGGPGRRRTPDRGRGRRGARGPHGAPARGPLRTALGRRRSGALQ
jgi:hypothetical protein